MMKMLKNPHEIEIEHLWWNVDLTPLHGLLSTPLPCFTNIIWNVTSPTYFSSDFVTFVFPKQEIYQPLSNHSAIEG